MLWNRRSALLLSLVALLPAAAGCVQQPVISLHHAEVRGLSAYGLGVVIFLQVRNDNAYDVQIRRVRCNVTFGRGTPIGPIDFAPNQWLPSNQTTLVAVPVSIPWALVPALAAETAGALNVPYHVAGSADVTATRALNIDRNDYPIDESGFVPRALLLSSARSMIPLPF